MRAALIGHGIAGSLTPELHMAEARAQGLTYRYDRFDTSIAPYAGLSASKLFDLAEAEGLAGVNVTHPFKLDAVRVVDELSPTAEAIGAINTVCFADRRRIGHNTDYAGFLSALKRRFPSPISAPVLLVGAGGAGAAVAFALVDHGAQDLWLCDKDRGRAKTLAHRIQGLRPNVTVTVVEQGADVPLEQIQGVVNATPLGMDGHPGMAVDPANLSRSSWVADIVYFPRDTALLQRARSQGLAVLGGAHMAVFQAAVAFHLITGRPAQAGRMLAEFERLSAPQQDIPA